MNTINSIIALHLKSTRTTAINGFTIVLIDSSSGKGYELVDAAGGCAAAVIAPNKTVVVMTEELFAFIGQDHAVELAKVELANENWH